jgi:hypothetical protein
MHISTGRLPIRITLAALSILPLALTGCTGRSAAGSSPSPAEQRQEAIAARQELEQIPPPSKARYMAIHSLTTWENPYLTVQGGMVTLHVLLADANTSTLGQGGMLRPVGARRQDLNIRVSNLPEALSSIPTSSWPYGRVVAVEEAHQVPVSARPEVRRNLEIVLKSLGDLGVVAYEWNDANHGL